MSQRKGQYKTPEKQLNEVEIGNLSEKEFRVMIVKMIQDLGKTMKKIQEMFTKDIQELKNKQRWIINTLEGINSRTVEAEEQINGLKARMVEITATEENEQKRMTRNEDSLTGLWNNIKQTNICILGGPRRRREKGPDKLFAHMLVK